MVSGFECELTAVGGVLARLNQGGLTELGDKPHILVHRSVKFRMENKHLEGGPYKPRLTNWDEMVPVFVD